MVVASFFEKALCFPDVVVVRRGPLSIVDDSGFLALFVVKAFAIHFGSLARTFGFVVLFLGEDVINAFHDFSVKVGQQYFLGVSVSLVAHFRS